MTTSEMNNDAEWIKAMTAELNGRHKTPEEV